MAQYIKPIGFSIFQCIWHRINVKTRLATEFYTAVYHIYDNNQCILKQEQQKDQNPPITRQGHDLWHVNPLNFLCFPRGPLLFTTAERVHEPLQVAIRVGKRSLSSNILPCTVFVDTRLWKTKHLRKRFQKFLQSCVLLTDRIEIHQSQPDSTT